ncbi:hypothetical protein EB118_07020 [bacterium]|nr:hypothetical protein [bacterium]NDC94396.1 hypothetical protein [bacterium]NDD83937.1 hypothetical protein [bacterium]NDG29832.1 hypothetical protein [bacterium]
MSKTIDYLSEDQPINGQRYALVSIVGPHMPQKCKVWALKIRGFADTIESAKSLSARIMKYDTDYDIYTVDVGKFFPLDVDPYQVSDIEYQNTQLNELIKNYLENRQSANDLWVKRKNEMMQEAIREGKNQAEMAARPEHPVSVLGRIRNYKDRQKELREQLDNLQKDVSLAEEKFQSYTEEEREIAIRELDNAVKDAATEGESSTLSIEEIRKELTTIAQPTTDKITETLNKLKSAEAELGEYTRTLENTDPINSPNVHKGISEKISVLTQHIDKLKLDLTNSDIVNEFVNSNYTNSQWESLDHHNTFSQASFNV